MSIFFAGVVIRSIFVLGVGIRTHVGICSYYETLKYKCLFYFMIWAATKIKSG
jgi:hypothetical protein